MPTSLATAAMTISVTVPGGARQREVARGRPDGDPVDERGDLKTAATCRVEVRREASARHPGAHDPFDELAPVSVDPMGLLAQLDIAHRRTQNSTHVRQVGTDRSPSATPTRTSWHSCSQGSVLAPRALPEGRQLLSADVPEGGHQ